jgi:hypothetical protein
MSIRECEAIEMRFVRLIAFSAFIWSKIQASPTTVNI